MNWTVLWDSSFVARREDIQRDAWWRAHSWEHRRPETILCLDSPVRVMCNHTNMATTQHEIDSYFLFHMTENFGQTTIINCYGGGSLKGSLYFYKEGTAIPASSKSSSGVLSLRFRENQSTDMLATLRQEQPLYIWFDDSYHCGGLKTSIEPVGEEEA